VLVDHPQPACIHGHAHPERRDDRDTPAGLKRAPTRVELTGDWEHRDVVILTGCFALLVRRRQDIAIMIAISSSHGS
jgi:hypothetical protein